MILEQYSMLEYNRRPLCWHPRSVINRWKIYFITVLYAWTNMLTGYGRSAVLFKSWKQTEVSHNRKHYKSWKLKDVGLFFRKLATADHQCWAINLRRRQIKIETVKVLFYKFSCFFITNESLLSFLSKGYFIPDVTVQQCMRKAGFFLLVLRF